MGKWSKWYDSLPESTKIYLKNQPIWHDRDMALAASVALAVGFTLGWLVHYVR